MSDIDDQWWRRGPSSERDNDYEPGDSDSFDDDTLPTCPHCGEELADEDVTCCPYCERYLSRDDVFNTRHSWWIIATAMVCLFVILFFLWH
jgi:hypothetical protein